MNRLPTRSSSVRSRRAVLGEAAAVGAILGLVSHLGHAAARQATPTPDPAAVEVETGVLYGTVDSEDLLLDVYSPPAREAPRPAVVLIHGGGWTQGHGDRSMMVEPAEGLAVAGYVAFNITYRLLTGEPGVNPWPAQLDDVQRAVRWIRANAELYNVDPERIASFGYSSGGHLAACLGVRETRDNSDAALANHSSRVTCVASVAGEMDLTIPYPQEVDQVTLVNLLGGTADEVPDAYRDASPISWVDGESAPFLIMQGAMDEYGLVAHARAMVAALHEAGVEVVYYEDPDADHGFQDPLADASVWGLWANPAPWMLTFFTRHLRPER